MADDQQPEHITPVPADIAKEAVSKQIHQMAFGLQLSQPTAPATALVEKLEPSHITSVIANSEAENKREHESTRMFFFGSVIGAMLLCSLFLYFNQASLVEKVLAAFLGFAGGYGYGRSSKSK